MIYVLLSETLILRSKTADVNSPAWFSYYTTKMVEFDQSDIAHTKVEHDGQLTFYFNIPDSKWPMLKIHNGALATRCDRCNKIVPYERDYGSPTWPMCEGCYGVKPDAKLGLVSVTAMKSARLMGSFLHNIGNINEKV